MIASAITFTGAAPIDAAEIDSLTRRGEPLVDSSAALERRLEAALDAAVARANADGNVCDEAALHRALRRALVSPFIGHLLAESLDADETLDRRHVLRAESIYRDLGLLDAISVHWKDLSGVIRVGDALIGVDKLGHFVVEGWAYFETAYVDDEGVDAALAWGERTERTYFGRYTTGVHSHADLVANFEGMRFWRRVVGRGDAPLDGGWLGDRPYVKCGRRLGLLGEQRWRRAGGVDLDDFVTPVWDEAVNCCSYRNEHIAELVSSRISELSAANGIDYTCPIDPAACAKARERYGAFAPRLLHPACLGAPVGERPWWRFWE